MSSNHRDESSAQENVFSSPFSNYFFQSLLGAGAFGEVIKCFKSATREMVAVKKLNNNNSAADVENEVAILRQLQAFDSDKFSVIRFIDSFNVGAVTCLEFEMLDMNLWDFLEKTPLHVLSVKEIRPILHQMATALQLLRSLGIVHTDLKPDNIMLVDSVNKPFKIKIIDFGLARYVSQITNPYVQPLHYRSPEAILRSPITTAIDMWSLGCIAAELFLGYALYPGDTEYNMLQHMMQTQGPLPPKLLNNGLKTSRFFRRIKGCKRSWRLKTPLEYGHRVTNSESYFNSLNDLKKLRPAGRRSNKDTRAKTKDEENFVDLLKKLLHLNGGQRITPSQLLVDPFITMCDLADNYPESAYVKSGCGMMEVCRDQSVSLLNPQASTSTAGLDQQASTSTAGLDQQASTSTANLDQQASTSTANLDQQASTSTANLDQSLSQPQQLSVSAKEDMTAPEPPLPSTFVAQIYTCLVSPVRNMESFFEALQSSDISLESTHSESKRMKTDLIETQAELPQTSNGVSAEASSSTAKAKARRKRTWDTVVVSNSGLRATERNSPERKKRKIREDPIQTLSSEAKIKPQRKRTWDTVVASHSGLRSLESTHSESKRMKTDLIETQAELPQTSNGVSAEASSSTAKAKARRKRTWDTVVVSNSGLRATERNSPERKKRKIREDPIQTLSSEAKSKSKRKRS